MIQNYRNAIVKWNGGRGALLCNRCRTIISEGFEHADVEHVCNDCSVVSGASHFRQENSDEISEKLALASATARAIERHGVTHAGAAAVAGVSESDIARIVRGLVDRYSVAELERVRRALK
jgi:hypothetical protein